LEILHFREDLYRIPVSSKDPEKIFEVGYVLTVLIQNETDAKYPPRESKRNHLLIGNVKITGLPKD